MNVSNGIENLAQIFAAQTTSGPAPAKGGSPPRTEGLANDKAQLSNVATHVAQSAAAPDVRLDKIASIQNALQAGTYEVSAGDVAKKVISSMLATGQ